MESTESTKRWYVVHAYSGMENSVAREITASAERAGFQDRFGEVLVPSEDVIESGKDGKRRVTKRRLYPGYVLVEMEMTDATWHLVNQITRVTGFLGGKKPSPLSDAEIAAIKARVNPGDNSKPRPKVEFQIGQVVRVKDGPFAEFDGRVDSLDYDKSRLRVLVTIFGRETPVDLSFSEVEAV